MENYSTGIYDPGLLDDIKELSIETPYGAPSEKITLGRYNGKKVAFMELASFL